MKGEGGPARPGGKIRTFSTERYANLAISRREFMYHMYTHTCSRVGMPFFSFSLTTIPPYYFGLTFGHTCSSHKSLTRAAKESRGGEKDLENWQGCM